MKKPEDIERQAEQALNSLDNIQSADANEFMFTRIKNRIAHHEALDLGHRKNVLLRLAAILILFVGINFLSFYILNKPQKAKPTESGIEAFAKAYGLNVNAESY